jgi:hypothetical protein
LAADDDTTGRLITKPHQTQLKHLKHRHRHVRTNSRVAYVPA